MNLAPVILFVYNRPWHTKQTIEALKKNELAYQTDLFIYSDGSKNAKDGQKVLEVREYLKDISGFKSITVIERDSNFGLANNIINGVTSIVNQYGHIIVLEDDLLTSDNFLRFMNDALLRYKAESNVYAVSGYSFADDESIVDSTYFLSITSSWSWATWADRWSIFSKDENALRKIINDKTKVRSFNYDNSYDYASMSRLQLDGKINSWAIFWYLSIFGKKGLTLFPAKRLVRNIGYDGTGTHCGNGIEEKELTKFEYELTSDICEKKYIKRIVQKALRSNKNDSFFKKIFRTLKQSLQAISHR